MYRDFLRNEAGAITTDWVMLTSALIVVAIFVVFTLFEDGWAPVTESINQQVGGASAELCNGNFDDCYVISK